MGGQTHNTLVEDTLEIQLGAWLEYACINTCPIRRPRKKAKESWKQESQSRLGACRLFDEYMNSTLHRIEQS